MSQKPLRFVPTEDLKKRFDTYMKKTNKSNASEVLRELFDFALRIKEQSTDDDSRTNRELMENMLERQFVHSRLLNNIFINTCDDNLSSDDRKSNMEKSKDIMILSQDAYANYMAKKSE